MDQLFIWWVRIIDVVTIKQEQYWIQLFCISHTPGSFAQLLLKICLTLPKWRYQGEELNGGSALELQTVNDCWWCSDWPFERCWLSCRLIVEAIPSTRLLLGTTIKDQSIKTYQFSSLMTLYKSGTSGCTSCYRLPCEDYKFRQEETMYGVFIKRRLLWGLMSWIQQWQNHSMNDITLERRRCSLTDAGFHKIRY